MVQSPSQSYLVVYYCATVTITALSLPFFSSTLSVTSFYSPVCEYCTGLEYLYSGVSDHLSIQASLGPGPLYHFTMSFCGPLSKRSLYSARSLCRPVNWSWPGELYLKYQVDADKMHVTVQWHPGRIMSSQSASGRTTGGSEPMTAMQGTPLHYMHRFALNCS